MATVAVRLIDVPHALDKDYTYFAPENILRGSLVEVPFGRTDRPYAAVVLGECETPENVTPKCISRVLDYPVRLTEELHQELLARTDGTPGPVFTEYADLEGADFCQLT